MSKELNFSAEKKTVSITTSTTVYAQGDCIGGLLEVTDLVDTKNLTSTLLDLQMIDIKNRTPAIDVLFYSASPGGTFTDNAAMAVTAADHASYFLGRVSIAAADWAAQAAGTNVKDVTKMASSCGFKLKSGSASTGKIYIALLCVAAPSGAYAAAAGDLTLRLGVDKD